jgi:hypothetical protein
VQTFLPYDNFRNCALALDRQRLGKQRVECLQILNALLGLSSGWRQHPATKMWAGYEGALWLYGQTMIGEWEARGYRNNMVLPGNFTSKDLKFPPWMGDRKFHASHRSNLLRKDPAWYGQFGWAEPNDLPYVWPV